MKVLGYRFDGENISCYQVQPDGPLTRVSRTPVRQADRYSSLFAVAPRGSWLCIAKDFNSATDGWNLDSLVYKPSRKKTLLSFYRLNAAGVPRFRKTLEVPGIALQLVPCPTGKRLFVNGGTQIVTVNTSASGTIRVAAVKSETGSYSFKDGGGERDATHLSISPHGKWAFAFDGDGFVDHQENYLQVFRIEASGVLRAVEPSLMNAGGGPGGDTAGPAGLLADGGTLLMKVGPYGGYAYLRFSRGILSTAVRLPESIKFWQLDPRGRFVFTGNEPQKTGRLRNYYLTVYRRVAPGKLVRVATYPEISGALALEPLGRFAYDQGSGQRGQLPALRTWKVLPDGRLHCLHKVPSVLTPQELQFAIL